ncbi:MAG: hypothetical protein AAGH19_04655 [Pseudomonadota bacterium]
MADTIAGTADRLPPTWSTSTGDIRQIVSRVPLRWAATTEGIVLTIHSVRLLAALALASISIEATSTESCCVDSDIAEAFLSNMTYSRDWPEQFPIKIEAGDAELIGSSISHRAVYHQVAWKTNSGPQAFLEQLVDQIIANDWQALPNESEYSYPLVGFLPYRKPAVSRRQAFCSDSDGHLTLSTRASDIGEIVTLTHSAQHGSQSCAEAIASYKNHAAASPSLSRYLPGLSLPKSLAHIRHPSRGTHSGGDQAGSSSTIKTTLPAANLSEHFAEQMAAQGWNLDANLVGRTVSGHIWERVVDRQSVSCIVTVRQGDDRLQMLMHLSRLD